MNPGFGFPLKETTSWMVYRGHSMSHSLLSTSNNTPWRWRPSWGLRTCRTLRTRSGGLIDDFVGSALPNTDRGVFSSSQISLASLQDQPKKGTLKKASLVLTPFDVAVLFGKGMAVKLRFYLQTQAPNQNNTPNQKVANEDSKCLPKGD